MTSPVTLGIFFGYVVGKPIGIVGAAWIGSRPRLGGIRPPVSWPALIGAGSVAGIGFTVSILIASLAFHGEQLEEAKLGVLAAAVGATLVSWAVFKAIDLLPDETQGASGRRHRGAHHRPHGARRPGARPHPRARRTRRSRSSSTATSSAPSAARPSPSCAQLLGEFGDDLRYVFRHLPLSDVHPRAQLAAEAAEAADAQGAFWPMHDLLFTHQNALKPTDLVHVRRGARPRRRPLHGRAAPARPPAARRPRTSTAPTAAASPARRRSSSTAAATRAPTTSRRSRRRSARRASGRGHLRKLARMRAMVLEAAGRPLVEAELPRPEPAPGQMLLRVRACGVCRTDLHIVDGELSRPEAAARPRPPDRRRGRGRPASRRALARLDLRRVPLLHERPREPLRPRPLHRLRPRRRLRRVGGRRRALLLPDPGRLPRPPGGAAALRGPDRLPRAPHGRRRRAPRSLRLRRLRPHRRAGRTARGASCLRLHARGRRGGPALRARAGRRVGRRRPRAGARASSTRRSSSRRPASWSRQRCARARRARRSSAPEST